ncbi:bacterio-opsin activator domain-containing protein [Halobacterium jilantaiense]|uniref:Predicted DNA binding protein, contains HTH domain n=1 Tax=Halobacterium jilantaiense TaxID=355548 RepID=A0A1I0PV68_9EURY|nr:bacterio-opsin activator domain-containing protein [Halobacterium jilantaiense]SEW18367.1 Predicted DNA binding protein, contains HTH domain [Halobacterium jilantaiense]
MSGDSLDRLQRSLEALAAGDTDVDPFDGDDRADLGEALRGVADRLDSLQRERDAERDRAAALFDHVTDPIARVTGASPPRVADGNDEFDTAFEGVASPGSPLADCFAEDCGDVVARVAAGEPVEATLRAATASGPADTDVRFVPVTGDEGYVVFDNPTAVQDEPVDRRQQLYEVTADPALSLDEKVERLLSMGCEWFGTGNGLLSRIDEATDDYRVERGVGPDPVSAGDRFPLSATYCRRTVDSDDILAIHDAPAEGEAADPGYADGGVTCYIGGRVVVDGRLYGTLCFYDEQPASAPFTALDRALVDLMTRWVSYELERSRRERSLAAVHDATVELLGVESVDAAAETVVETVEDVLDDAVVAFYQFRPTTGEFAPVATTPGFATGDPPALSVGAASPAWECLVDGEIWTFGDPAAVAADWTPENGASGGVLVPAGDHGLFVVATTTGPPDGDRRHLVETAATSAEAAFDRLASESDLRAHERELAERNDRLQRRVQVTEIMRTVNRSLIAAESRASIEAAVCQGLADATGIKFAWVGGWDADEGRLSPRTWAGDGGTYLDAVSLRADRREPAVVAARDGVPAVVGTVAEGVTVEAWREHATACGFASALAVPLSVDGHSHGVLAVYADEAGAFGDLEADVFGELGETIADAMAAVAAREALQADTHAELRLSVAADDTVLAQLQADTGGRVVYEGAANRGDGNDMFVSVAGASRDEVADALADRTRVTDYQHVASAGDRHAFEVTTADDSLPRVLARSGGNPQSIVADESDDLSVVVDVPADSDVRAYVDSLRSRYDSVELDGRRDVERSARTREELVQDLFDALTERQLEVLRTAYLAGFFEWPRETTGEGVAELLGVSQPTVNRHLRVAQRRLFEELFSMERPPAVRE